MSDAPAGETPAGETPAGEIPAGETPVGETSGRRRSRRARRDDSASKSDLSGPAYITRQIPPYELLGEEGLVTLEKAADRILAEVGIEFRGDEEVIQLWKKAGADVSGERLRFEPGMLREIVQATTPRSFIQYARNPANSVQIGGDACVFAPTYGAPFVQDLEGGRRYGTLEDFENLVKLAQSSPWLHHSGGVICEPVDIPVNKRHLDMVYAHIRYSDRPFMGSVTAAERAEDSIEMARLVFGRDFVEQNCVILGNINVNSPLVFDDTMTAALKAYSKANQCTVVVPFILGGAMGPVTTAGAVAQSFAEAMAGCALIQLIRPGARAIFGNFLSSMSLKSGAPTFGMPEPAIGYFAIGQLARRLGVPLRCGGSLSASKLPDFQAAQETADSLMPTLLAGANFVLHAAGWLEGGLVMGYEKFVLDCDHLGMMHSFMKGLALDENALAIDAFHEVQPGNHFLGCAHTMANYTTAFFDPPLSDNRSFEQWRDEGSQDALQRANVRWKEQLTAYQAPDIDPGLDEALKDFVQQRKAAVADSWY